MIQHYVFTNLYYAIFKNCYIFSCRCSVPRSRRKRCTVDGPVQKSHGIPQALLGANQQHTTHTQLTPKRNHGCSSETITRLRFSPIHWQLLQTPFRQPCNSCIHFRRAPVLEISLVALYTHVFLPLLAHLVVDITPIIIEHLREIVRCIVEPIETQVTAHTCLQGVTNYILHYTKHSLTHMQP